MDDRKDGDKKDSSEMDIDLKLLKSKALDSLLSAVVITNNRGEVIYANPAFCDLWEVEDSDEVTGRLLGDFVKEKNKLEKVVDDALNKGKWEGELELSREDSDLLEVKVSATPIETEGEPVARMVTFTDITSLREKTRTIRRQAEQLIESSTPIIEVWDGVLAAPLIGQLDTERTQRFMERLLEEIVDSQSETALIDITGVPDVDTRTAQHLIETVESVKLLGAKVVLTGISPSIAQSIVHLGIDLSEITTKTTLAEGLKHIFTEDTPWKITQ